MKRNIPIQTIIDLYTDSCESAVVLDEDKTVFFLNGEAKKLFGEIENISEIEHFFSISACILYKENFLEYNPIWDMFNSLLGFSAQTLYQIGEGNYKNLILRSFVADGKRILIFTDITEKIQNETFKTVVEKQQETIETLEKNNREFARLNENAQNLAIRTGLLNKISDKIKESFDINEIIKTIVDETAAVFGVQKAFYKEYNEYKEYNAPLALSCEEKTALEKSIKNGNSPQEFSFLDENTSESILSLVTPVCYHEEVFGALFFRGGRDKKTFQGWHEEEIKLAGRIAIQLASAIKQARLFKELEKTIEELKKTQIQLVQSEKMASLGHLVAGIAHEINTPIGSIKSNNDIFSRCLQKIKTEIIQNKANKIPEALTAYLGMLEETLNINSEAVRRISSIIKALKTFARLDQTEYIEADIHEGIKSTLMLINHELKGKIKVQKEFSALPPIKCYPNLLNQLFMNILVNACQSINGEGTISIKSENLGNSAKITISDTGSGIAEENLERIFDPGFTTKGVGIGTGLGLSICYRIVQKHNGTISALNNPDGGASFVIEIPFK